MKRMTMTSRNTPSVAEDSATKKNLRAKYTFLGYLTWSYTKCLSSSWELRTLQRTGATGLPGFPFWNLASHSNPKALNRLKHFYLITEYPISVKQAGSWKECCKLPLKATEEEEVNVSLRIVLMLQQVQSIRTERHFCIQRRISNSV